MAIVLVQMPSVNPAPLVRAKQCPYCGSVLLQSWGTVCKPLRDTDFEAVQAYRFRCTECERTFRLYPQGVDKADLSQRLRCLYCLSDPVFHRKRRSRHRRWKSQAVWCAVAEAGSTWDGMSTSTSLAPWTKDGSIRCQHLPKRQQVVFVAPGAMQLDEHRCVLGCWGNEAMDEGVAI
jgi:DNA-directed RNA polymerase subunit RPC12/RpoP